MIDVQDSVIIDRPVEEVWKLMADLANAHKWDLWREGTRQTSPGSVEVGTTFQTIFRIRSRQLYVFDQRITEWEPNKKMQFYSENFGPLKKASLTFTLEPVDGKTRLSKQAKGQLWGVWRLLQPIGPWLVQREDELASVKRLVESPGST